jgi:hypothetical protein
MSFVSISGNLTAEVRSRISSMRNAELAQLGENPANQISFTGNEAWLHERAWQGRLDLLTVLPEAWVARPERVDYVLHAMVGGQETIIHNFRCNTNKQIQLPPIYKNFSCPDVRIHFSEGETLPTEIEECLSYRLKQKEIELRWDKVKTAVGEFLSNCKSLNEALKLWPALKVYIPDHYLQRVEKKAERREKEKSDAMRILGSIDKDEVQAAAIIARMSGANI